MTAPVRSADGPMITSKQNGLVKDFLALRRSARRRRDEGLSLVEGFKILELALRAGSTPAVVLYHGAKMREDEWRVLDLARRLGGTTREVSDDVLTRVSAREGPLDCVASVAVAETRLDGLTLAPVPLLVVMEGLEKPGNLGSLARTASAGGADALITADSQTDIYSPATVHASLGSVFSLPVVRCTTGEATSWLAERGIGVVATTPGAKYAYYDVDLTGPLAIVIGNEHRGLSASWIQGGTPVLIPMTGVMNSLNATIAGGIVLYEALRQRAVAARA